MPLEIRDGNGDKTMNPVFDKEKYLRGAAGFDASTKRAAARTSVRRTGR